MEHADIDGDDMYNTVCGDLGLGNAVRSRLLLNDESEDNEIIPLYHLNEVVERPRSPSNDVRYKFQELKKGFLGSVIPRVIVNKNNNNSNSNNSAEAKASEEDKSEEVFPTYADVPYGTSYRQQKKLYEQQIGSLRQQQNAMIFLGGSSPAKKTSKRKDKEEQIILTAEELDVQIQHAIEEMDELKIELDACCKRLDAKYQAVAILKKQAEAANSDLQTTEKRFLENNKHLEKELSKLQFELEWKESSFLDSQQTWAERFDRVCRDNASLTSKLEARNEEMRRALAHKAAIGRERDELLALLDVTERMKYEQGKSLIGEEEYGSFSSTELAVLGACKCRGANPEPCGCAHAAANLRKEVVKLREEVKETIKRRQEAYLTVDAYRQAFEEQMAKSRQMSQQLASMSTLTSRSVKAKAAMRFLLKSLSSEDEDSLFGPTKTIDNHCEETPKSTKDKSVMTLQELVQALTDVVHEKEEALAQQKLAAQVLANKLDELEKQFPHYSRDSTAVNDRRSESVTNNGDGAKDDDNVSKENEHRAELNGMYKSDLHSSTVSHESFYDPEGEDEEEEEEENLCEAIGKEIELKCQHDCNSNDKESPGTLSDLPRDNENSNREGKGGTNPFE